MSSTPAPFNPFLKKNLASSPVSLAPVGPMAYTPAQAAYVGGAKPFIPAPSQTTPAAGMNRFAPVNGSTAPPLPANATPFMPSSTASSAPPIHGAAPPPIHVSPASPYEAMPNSSGVVSAPVNASSGKKKKGMTAAGLYSINSIGADGSQQTSTIDDQENESQQKMSKESTPMKPCNSNDRINLNRIPHPEEDNYLRTCTFETDDDYISTFPVPTNQYIFKDNGNSNPRYMRPTMRIFPQSYFMFNKAKVPASIFITPFADPGVGEAPIPTVDARHGLVRCSNCFAYMNSNIRFINQGHQFICNLCGVENTVPSWYYATTDMDGKRFDRLEKPELSCGTVDFLAGKEFYVGESQKPVFGFVVDITRNSHNLGVFPAVLSAIRACVETLRENELSRVGVCLVDVSCRMMCMRNGRIKEILMTDSDDAYASINASHWLLSPSTQYDAIQTLLSYIEQQYDWQIRQTIEHSVCIAAVKTVAGAMAYCGGQIIVIECTAPMLGVGRVSSSENVSLYGTNDESQLYLCSQDESFYTELGTACALSGVTVDIIIASKDHVHLAEQQILTHLTGGRVCVMNDIGSDQPACLTELHAYIQNLVIQPHYWDTVMKMRVSGGLKVESYCGCLTRNDDGDPIVPLLDNHSTIEVSLDLPKYLTEKTLYSQMAVLNDKGERRIRVFNQKYHTAETYPRFFKGIDGPAIGLALARTASIQSNTLALPEVRANIQETVEEMMTQYRQQCSASSSTGQLVLPENGKTLPLMLNGLLKGPMLLLNEQGKRELMSVVPRGDVRAWAMQYVMRCSPQQFITFVYPSLSHLDEKVMEWGREDEVNGYLSKPNYLFLTSASLDLSGVYLLNGVRGITLIVGNKVSPELLYSLFGVQSIPDTAYASQLSLLPEGDDYCFRVNNLVSDLQARFGYHLIPRVVVRGTTEASRVLEMMTEDIVRTNPSFSDFLMQLHSNIISSVYCVY